MKKKLTAISIFSSLVLYIIFIFNSCTPIYFDSAPTHSSKYDLSNLTDYTGFFIGPLSSKDILEYKNAGINYNEPIDYFENFYFSGYKAPKLGISLSDTLSYLKDCLTSMPYIEINESNESIFINSYFLINKVIYNNCMRKNGILIKSDSSVNKLEILEKIDSTIFKFTEINKKDTTLKEFHSKKPIEIEQLLLFKLKNNTTSSSILPDSFSLNYNNNNNNYNYISKIKNKLLFIKKMKSKQTIFDIQLIEKNSDTINHTQIYETVEADSILNSKEIMYNKINDTLIVRFNEDILFSLFSSKLASKNSFIRIKDFPIINHKQNKNNTMYNFFYLAILILLISIIYYFFKKTNLQNH
jgi:hypothetical protein